MTGFEEKKKLPRPLRWVIFALLLAALTVAFRRPLFQNNFGVVDPDYVFRSAQPASEFRQLIQERKLKSVLNLRGGTEFDPWYVSEVCAAHEHNVAFYDLLMSATSRPSRRQLVALMDVLERCRYPLLIHCKSGSDRTGLASALYLMQIRGTSPREALRSFSLSHGHIPLGGPGSLHSLFYEYDGWLRKEHLNHTSARFREWVTRHYDETGCEPPFIPPPRPPSSRIAEANPRLSR